jgi:hypothetical protein
MYLETIWKNEKTGIPYSFELFTLKGNWDVAVRISENWLDRNNNAEIRFYVWQWRTKNTFAALRKLQDVFEKKENFEELKTFIDKVTVKNLEWELTVKYIKEENKFVFEILQKKEAWNETCDKTASIAFSLEGSKKVDAFTLKVKESVFKCLSYLQNEMKGDWWNEDWIMTIKSNKWKYNPESNII